MYGCVAPVKTCVSHERLTEFLLRTLQVKKIPYVAYDLASDEEASGPLHYMDPPLTVQLCTGKALVETESTGR